MLTGYACIFTTALGASSTFFGYFLLGPVLFTAAFLVGGGACFVAVRAGLTDAASTTSAWVAVLAMLLGGGASGFLSLKVLSVGMFAVGATLGFAAAEALKPLVWARFLPSYSNSTFIAVCVVFALVCGLVALALRKQMLILSTAYAGAFALCFSVGHFAGHFPSLEDLDSAEHGTFHDTWTVVYLAATMFFGTAGFVVQLNLARDKPMPTHAPLSRYRDHRRVRSSSPPQVDRQSSLGDDKHWERELLAATSRIEGLVCAQALSRQMIQAGHTSSVGSGVIENGIDDVYSRSDTQDSSFYDAVVVSNS
jgi:hypothetical protein